MSALVFSLAAIVTGLFVEAGTSFEVVNRVRAGFPSTIAIYRLNGGATTDFALAIRQEWQIVPGLSLVRELDRVYPAYSASCEVTPLRTAVIRIDPYEDRGPFERRYYLARFVYF